MIHLTAKQEIALAAVALMLLAGWAVRAFRAAQAPDGRETAPPAVRGAGPEWSQND